MGCIGFPNHPVWEVTSACNEHCIHCHTAGGKRSPDELTTEEGKRLIEQIAFVKEFRMLVFTGGEPMVRPDLMDLLAHSKRVGFKNVIATNGILIDDSLAKELRKLQVVGLAISLDHTDPAVHNYIRQRDDAFERAIRAIQACQRAGIVLQINITAMQYNLDDLENLYQMASDMGAAIVLNYQLVPVGRGVRIKEKQLTRDQNEALLSNLCRLQKRFNTVIEPVAGPQYWAMLLSGSKNGRPKPGPLRRLGFGLVNRLFHGCTAGRGLVYIKPNGDVWACPFMELSAGNIRRTPFRHIWQDAPLFLALRDRSLLKGTCGTCAGKEICGGCRGRAMALTGDLLGEDPACFLEA